MSLSAERRGVLAGAAAGAVVLPLASNAAPVLQKGPGGRPIYPGNIVGGLQGGGIPAPVIELFDSRGCDVRHVEYQGPKSGSDEDAQCIKISYQMISVSETTAAKKLQEFVSFRGTSLDVDAIPSAQIASNVKTYDAGKPVDAPSKGASKGKALNPSGIYGRK